MAEAASALERFPADPEWTSKRDQERSFRPSRSQYLQRNFGPRPPISPPSDLASRCGPGLQPRSGISHESLGARAGTSPKPESRLACDPPRSTGVSSFSRAVGADVWVKLDDLNGVATGGNKVRKLEFLLGEAASIDADTLVTVEHPSPTTLARAAAAAMNGLDCHLVLGGNRPSAPHRQPCRGPHTRARVHFAGTDNWDVLESRAEAWLTSFAGGSASVRHAHWRLDSGRGLGFLSAHSWN